MLTIAGIGVLGSSSMLVSSNFTVPLLASTKHFRDSCSNDFIGLPGLNGNIVVDPDGVIIPESLESHRGRMECVGLNPPAVLEVVDEESGNAVSFAADPLLLLRLNRFCIAIGEEIFLSFTELLVLSLLLL